MPLLKVSSFWLANGVRPKRSSQPSIWRARLSAAERGVEFEQVQHFHGAMEAALFREVADGAGPEAGGAVAEHLDFAFVRYEDVGDHPHGGAFAGAVGADEAVDGAEGNLQVEVADGDVGAEALGDALDPNGIVGHLRNSTVGVGGFRLGGVGG
jgi:hypothetical protein